MKWMAKQVECKYKPWLIIASFLVLSLLYHQSVYVGHAESKEPEGKYGRFFPQSSAPQWLNKSVEDMSEAEMLKYLHWADKDACFLSYDFGGKKLVLNEQTGIDGQKTVCMDKGLALEPGNCLVYSFGINFEWTFDDAMEKYGCQVYSFDPSMGVKSHQRSPGIRFYDLGLGSVSTDSGPNGWKMRTLPDVYKVLKKRHGDVPIDVLKVDIEDNEWAVLPQIIQSGFLDNVKQIAMEIHIISYKDTFSVDKLRKKLGIIQNLEQSGMVRYALRPNPYQTSEVMGEKDHLLYELAWFNVKYKDANPIP